MTFKKYALKELILMIGEFYMGFVDTFIITPIVLCITSKKD